MRSLRGREGPDRRGRRASSRRDAGFSVLPVAYAAAVLMLVVAVGLLRGVLEVTRP